MKLIYRQWWHWSLTYFMVSPSKIRSKCFCCSVFCSSSCGLLVWNEAGSAHCCQYTRVEHWQISYLTRKLDGCAIFGAVEIATAQKTVNVDQLTWLQPELKQTRSRSLLSLSLLLLFSFSLHTLFEHQLNWSISPRLCSIAIRFCLSKLCIWFNLLKAKKWNCCKKFGGYFILFFCFLLPLNAENLGRITLELNILKWPLCDDQRLFSS